MIGPIDPELFARTAPAWNCVADPGQGPHYLAADGSCQWCGATRRPGRARWITGPFAVMTLGQRCAECRAEIPPGSTGHRCEDGTVRCDRCGHECPKDQFLNDPITVAYGVGGEMVHLIDCAVCDAEEAGR